MARTLADSSIPKAKATTTIASLIVIVIATIIVFPLAVMSVGFSPSSASAFAFPNNFFVSNQDAVANNQFTNLIRQCISANLVMGAIISNNPPVFCTQLIQSDLNQAPNFYLQCLSTSLGFLNNPFGFCRQQLQIFVNQLLTQNNNNLLIRQIQNNNNGLTPFFPQSNGIIQFQFPRQPITIMNPFIAQPPLSQSNGLAQIR